MISRLFSLALIVMLFGNIASAAPLYNISVLGSTSASGPFTSDLEVTPGQTVFYRLTGSVAPVGTVNGARTITSIGSMTVQIPVIQSVWQRIESDSD